MPRSTKSKGDVKAQKSRAQERQSLAKTAKALSTVSVPSHLKVITFDSPEWKSLVEEYGTPYQNARGIVNGYISEQKSPVEDWFKSYSECKGKDHIQSAQSVRDSVFSTLKDHVTDPRILKIEQAYYNKFGDFKKLGWANWSDVLYSMYKVPNWSPQEDTLQSAIADLIALFPKKLKPVSVREAFDASYKKGNSGMPFNTSRWATNPEMVDYYINQAEEMLNGIRPEFPAVLFTRRQPKGLGVLDVKMRAVECPVKGDSIAGTCFLVPLYPEMKALEPFKGYNGAANIGNNLQTALSLYEYAFEGDFSAFDSKVWTWWMEIIFTQVLPNIFQGDHSAYFNMIKDWYSNMDVFTPNGIVSGTHGLFSGCIWTNVIGTFVNYISTRYAMRRLGFDDTEYMNFSYGDDIAIFSEREIDMELFESFMIEVSMDCNKSKQAQSSGSERMISFLGFYHLNGYWPKDDYIGVFPTLRSLPAIVFRERDHGYDKDTAMSLGNLTREEFDSLRYVGKMENWRNHPAKAQVLEKLTSLGMRLAEIRPETANKSFSGSRSSYDRNISSLWIYREGYINLADPTTDQNVKPDSDECNDSKVSCPPTEIIKPEPNDGEGNNTRQSEKKHVHINVLHTDKPGNTVYQGPHCDLRNRPNNYGKEVEVQTFPSCQLSQRPKPKEKVVCFPHCQISQKPHKE